jgi:iduronate 2-sulfatase
MRLRQQIIALINCFSLLLCVGSAMAAERPNVLLLCIDDLRPELHCYGMDYIHSPSIDRLAASGRAFSRHYVQAPTCGASRFALLTGRYGGASNNALFQRAAQMQAGKEVPPSMPAWFRQHGYTTVSVGKVSHHPGGRGGPDWNDDNQPEMPDSWDRHLLPAGDWQHPRGHMHGLAHGEIRENAKAMDVFQSAEGDDSIYPDGLTTEEALNQIDLLTADAERPFFLAVGIIRPHLPFGAPAKYMQPYRDATLPAISHPEKPQGKTTWHGSGEFMKYNRWKRNPNDDAEFAVAVRKHYAACVTYADALVGRILEHLKASGQWDDTVIVLWGDHGWHLGEHAIWGKHALFEESLRSPLIISYAGIPKPGIQTQAVVETIDIFPTLCELTGLPLPTFAAGESVRPMLENPATTGHPAVSYFGRNRTIRTDTHRLIAHGDGFLELYDHQVDAGETQNIAAQSSQLVAQLLGELDDCRPAAQK